MPGGRPAADVATYGRQAIVFGPSCHAIRDMGIWHDSRSARHYRPLAAILRGPAWIPVAAILASGLAAMTGSTERAKVAWPVVTVAAVDMIGVGRWRAMAVLAYRMGDQ